ncbi:MAG: hypothetical protein DRJ65_05355 [Acidobacteria bacterium]|nr:MAG: hypothetical protein DRJ65_05355 [Acidobacteriota bacterium]
MKSVTVALVLTLSWVQLCVAGPRDLSVQKPPNIQVFEAPDQVPLNEILAYLPEGRILAVASGLSKSLKGVPWTLESAVTPTLRRALAGTETQRLVPIIVGLAPGVSLDQAGEVLEAGGGTVIWRTDSGTVARIGLLVPIQALGTTVGALEAFDGLVVFVDVQPGARLQNARSAPLCQGGDFVQTPLFNHGLLGQDQIIGLMDTGIDADSCFFADPDHGLPALNNSVGTDIDPGHRKILAVDFWWTEDWPQPGAPDWDSQGHGTHTAGSAAGDADFWGTFEGNDGMAPAAQLVIQDGGYEVDDCADLPGLGCPVRPLEPMLAQAWAQGARIHSNSWGDAEESWPLNRYTEPTADIDRFVWEHPQMVVVAAAGNAGWRGDDTVISPSTGKNVVSVGALGSVDFSPLCPADFSSRGWTHDGRIKPDVMAPGSGVMSAENDFFVGVPNCGVRAGSGTSMATPTVAGLAALVRQYFMEGWFVFGRRDVERGFEPSAALVKAVLVASAVDLTTLGCSSIDSIPSRDQGWGLVQLDRALWFEGENRRMSIIDRLDHFDSEVESVGVVVDVDQTADLKVVLSWTDAPSTSTADTNLVNDLDLEVQGPDGMFRGNVMAEGLSVAGGQADRLNNIEVVILPEVTSGQWTIRVRPHTISAAPQGFALVILGGEGVTVVPEPRKPGGGRSG